MAAYCTQTDVEHAAGGAAKLLALADQDGDGVLDAVLLADAINDAERWIDSYIQRRYSVPLDTVPDIVRRVCSAETVYILKDARDAVDSRAQSTHDEHRDWLEGVSYSRISLGVDPGPAKSSAVAAQVGNRSSNTDDDGDSIVVTRESLKGFW